MRGRQDVEAHNDRSERSQREVEVAGGYRLMIRWFSAQLEQESVGVEPLYAEDVKH